MDSMDDRVRRERPPDYDPEESGLLGDDLAGDGDDPSPQSHVPPTSSRHPPSPSQAPPISGPGPGRRPGRPGPNRVPPRAGVAHVPTTESRVMVLEAARSRVAHSEIADRLSISVATLRRRYHEELDQGKQAATGQGLTRQYQPTEISRETVRNLAGLGMPMRGIARVLGITIHQLVRCHQADVEHGVDVANKTVAQALYDRATNVDDPKSVTAGIFWMRSRGGWRGGEEGGMSPGGGMSPSGGFDWSKATPRARQLMRELMQELRQSQQDSPAPPEQPGGVVVDVDAGD